MHGEHLTTARILVVDDQEPNTRLLGSLLRREGYTHVRALTDARQAIGAFAEFHPDLVVLDLMMPYMDGFEVMDALRPLIAEDGYLPILVLTADVTQHTRRRALAAGAMDFLVKPFDPLETLARIRNLLLTRTLHMRLRDQNALLEESVRVRTQDLEETRLEVLERLARAAEYRDDATGQHTQRVGRLSSRVAAALGLPEDRTHLIRHAAPLHDVGKIGIPDMMTNDRPYRRALPTEEAWDILWEGAGRLWDADVVDAMASFHVDVKGGRDGRADAARAVHR